MAEDLSRGPKIHTVIAYQFAAHDGGYKPFTYWPESPRKGVHCPNCYSVLDYNVVAQKVSVRGRSDVFYAEGHIIVTHRFREFCRRSGYEDIEFPCVDRARPLFELRPTRIVDVDVVRSEPLFSEFCLRCGNFRSYTLGRALFLRDATEPLEDGFYRTDLVFGSTSKKSPLILVGPDTRDKIEAQRFSRLRFTPLPMVDKEFEIRKQRGLDAYTRYLRRVSGGRPWRRKSAD